jgi:hypothetical protein
MAETLKMKDVFTVTIKDENDPRKILEEFQLAVVRPNSEQIKKGQNIYNETYSEALKSKAVVRAKVEQVLEEQGVWNKEKEEQVAALNKELLEGERTLYKGGIKFTDAVELAKKMQKTRLELARLSAPKNDLYSNTAEAQADNARFNYYLSVCTRREPGGEPYFKNLQDVYDRVNDAGAILASSRFALLQYNLDNNFQLKYPENKFLYKYKLINSRCQWLNRDGKPVSRDEDGTERLIDEDGRFVDSEGRWVDRAGNLVNKDGELIGEFEPFLDDQGNNIVEE